MRGLLIVLILPLGAADWPRFGGPTGDFRIALPDSPLRWPEGGPKPLWQRSLGDGYSSIVVAGAALYTMYRREDKQEVVVSLDADTGKTLWEYSYDAPLPADFDRFSASDGPRASPLIVGDLLFTVGAAGKMHALNRHNGKVVWSHDFISDFDGKIRVNGYAPSPIAWRDTVIVFPNAPNAAVAALRQSTGEVVWKKHSFLVSYATPILINASGRDQFVTQFSDHVTGLDPASGDLLWSYPHTNEEKVNAAIPVWREDGFLFLSNAYGGGSKMLHLDQAGGTKVEELWTQRLVRIHHSDPVRIGDIIYAATGDLGPCPLSATELKTGRVLWRDRNFPKASLVAVGDQLLILDEDGTLALGTPGEKGLDIHGKIAVLAANSWTPPTVVGKRIYLRDRSTIRALVLD
jgi:outer membrane protein assembly factor BamB